MLPGAADVGGARLSGGHKRSSSIRIGNRTSHCVAASSGICDARLEHTAILCESVRFRLGTTTSMETHKSSDLADLPGEFYSTLFDLIPCPTLVLDSDLGVIVINRAAAKLWGELNVPPRQSRPGELLRCIHTVNGARCGEGPQCWNCKLRNAVNRSLLGEPAHRRLHSTVLVRDGHPIEISLLVTATAFRHGNQAMAAVCLEDVSELIALQSEASVTRCRCEATRTPETMSASRHGNCHASAFVRISSVLNPRGTPKSGQ